MYIFIISKQIDLYTLSIIRLISKDGINLVSQFFNFINTPIMHGCLYILVAIVM